MKPPLALTIKRGFTAWVVSVGSMLCDPSPTVASAVLADPLLSAAALDGARGEVGAQFMESLGLGLIGLLCLYPNPCGAGIGWGLAGSRDDDTAAVPWEFAPWEL
ncbi:MAG: hypothetical protein ACREKE_00560 [bacterium]